MLPYLHGQIGAQKERPSFVALGIIHFPSFLSYYCTVPGELHAFNTVWFSIFSLFLSIFIGSVCVCVIKKYISLLIFFPLTIIDLLILRQTLGLKKMALWKYQSNIPLYYTCLLLLIISEHFLQLIWSILA